MASPAWLLVAALGLVVVGCTPDPQLRKSFAESYDGLMRGDEKRPAAEAAPAAAAPEPVQAAALPPAAGGFTVVTQGQAIEQSYAQIGDRKIAAGARFIDADANEFLRIVFEEILMVPFVTVGRLEGQVSLELAPGLPLSTWIDAIDTRIQPLGGALRFERGVFAAVKEGEALFESSANVGFLPLTYADPSDVAKILGDVFPGVKVIAAEAASALIVLEFRRLALFLELAEFARTLDRGSLKGRTLFIQRLIRARAEEVVRELEVVTGLQGLDAGDYRFARFLPIQRLNAVLGVVTPGTDIDALRALMVSLDRVDTPRLAKSVRLVTLKNSRAADVVTQIRALIVEAPVLPVVEAVAPRPAGRESYYRGRPEAADSGTVTVTTDTGSAPIDGAPDPLLEAPRPARADAYAPYAAAAPEAAAGQAFRITADPSRNAILMSGPPETLNSIEALIHEIDREEVRQVYIETALVDITLNEQLQYGLSSFLEAGDVQIIPFSGAATLAPSFPGLNILFDNSTIAGVLSLLSSVSDVRVISAPRLAMVNNSEAVLNVGDEVPVLTSQVVDTSNPDAVVNSIEFRETGVILRLAPTIMSDEAVLLDISQELTEARGTSAEAVQLTPLFTRRALETSLRLYSGDVIMLGGLKERSAAVTKDRLPIPVLGDLFGNTGDTTNLREMVLLVRPLIVKDQQQMNRVTKEVRERLDAIWGIDSLRKNILRSGDAGLSLDRELNGALGTGPREPSQPWQPSQPAGPRAAPRRRRAIQTAFLRRARRHSIISGRRGSPLPYPRLSSRHLLPGPIAMAASSALDNKLSMIAASWNANVIRCRSGLRVLGPGNKSRDDSGVCIDIARQARRP